MFDKKFKCNDPAIDLTLSQIVEKYCERNYVFVDYKANGDVNVMIGASKKTEVKVDG